MPTKTTQPGISLRQLAEREERVFPTYPQVARYFPAASMEEARGRLTRAIERGDGPGIVVGGPGTGKSLLLQVLASQFHERFDVVLPACARLCTRRALLQAILFELGLPYRVRDEGDLRLSLLDHLLSREECPTGLLLLVDEAQTLSIPLLDELRVLTNLVRGGLPRVRLVLAGSSALEECFAHPELESFSQRLSARCYLGPFGREETAQFVRAQIGASAATPEDIFAPDAWQAIFDATDGVPRLVNQLCDRALTQANSANKSRIDRQIVQTAWADIQQLPAPWETPAPTTAPPAPLQVVEFGSLDEEPGVHHLISKQQSATNIADDDLDCDGDFTEIDEEEVVSRNETNNAIPAAAALPLESETADPFAEEFDEEEVVIDNFASWDDAFRRAAPRVENRRDPEFSAMVHAAVTTADAAAPNFPASTVEAFRMLVAGTDEDGTLALDPPTAQPEPAQEELTWPPLRLAIVTDTAPPEPLRNTRAVETKSESYDDLPSWSHAALSASDHRAEQFATEDEPILIVEDDNAPKSPVRREEYRNLFSRLRSG